MFSKPKIVIILSGKRKSGKDYITNIIKSRLNNLVKVIHISEPIKSEYSKINKIDFDQLMSDSDYKERYRRDMVRWSEAEKLNQDDPNYFLKLSLQMKTDDNKPIWLISDARRLSDIKYFQQNQFDKIQIITIRINCSEEVRKQRGWTFVTGIDDAQTECGLDEYQEWTHLVTNNGVDSNLMTTLDDILDKVKESIKI